MEIFVSNLSYQITDTELRDAFAQYGEVRRATVAKDRETGRSRGFGFVDMPDADAAKKAIAELNGKPVQGRSLMVSEARPRTAPGAAPVSAGSRPPFAPGNAPSGPRPPMAPPRPMSSSPSPMLSPPRAPSSGGSVHGVGEPPPEEGEARPPRRFAARPHSFPGKDRKKGDKVEEGKRRPPVKGIEKGRKANPWRNPDEDEEEGLPCRLR